MMNRFQSPKLSCRDSALQLLSRRDHGRCELVQKLKAKGYPQAEIDQVIEYCDHFGYLDDQRFAQALVRQHISKGHGELRIRQELKHKQLAADMIELALQQADVDWFELARQTAEKKFDVMEPVGQKEKAKQIRFLQYRGFSFEQIQYALDSEQ